MLKIIGKPCWSTAISRSGSRTRSAATLADIVIGLSLNRWAMTPMARPDYPHVAACLARLAERPGYRAWCANGVP
jgi:glutathione S-transferase